MAYLISEESFAALGKSWSAGENGLNWPHIFMLPPWMEAWWQLFGSQGELRLLAVRRRGGITGIAPLLLRGETASFVGSADLCDYLDFIVSPGEEEPFFNCLLDYLTREGIKRLDLRPLRPDSAALLLADLALKRGCRVQCSKVGLSLELELPQEWEQYLAGLSKKQRHEVRRKLRRLEQSGEVSYRVWQGAENGSLDRMMDLFCELFRASSPQKAAFLTPERELFFRTLAGSTARLGLLRLGFLELDGRLAAAVFCFSYNGSLYLYNSGFDPGLGALSVGLAAKVYSIRYAIEAGLQRYDFLSGGERYKHHLGGSEVQSLGLLVEIHP